MSCSQHQIWEIYWFHQDGFFFFQIPIGPPSILELCCAKNVPVRFIWSCGCGHVNMLEVLQGLQQILDRLLCALGISVDTKVLGTFSVLQKDNKASFALDISLSVLLTGIWHVASFFIREYPQKQDPHPNFQLQ